GVAELAPLHAAVRVCLLASSLSSLAFRSFFALQQASTAHAMLAGRIILATLALLAPSLAQAQGGVEEALAVSPFFAHDNKDHSYAKRDNAVGEVIEALGDSVTVCLGDCAGLIGSGTVCVVKTFFGSECACGSALMDKFQQCALCIVNEQSTDYASAQNKINDFSNDWLNICSEVITMENPYTSFEVTSEASTEAAEESTTEEVATTSEESTSTISYVTAVDTPLYFATNTVTSTSSSTITSAPSTSTSLDTITASTTSSWCCRAHQVPDSVRSSWSKVRLESAASASILSEWSSLKSVAATAIVVSNITSAATALTAAAPTATDNVSGGGNVFAEVVLAAAVGLVAAWLA
ncbi:hypothetical protein BCR35DRAFT_339078, partial [Leucosporidium creatinivorum]